MTQSRINFKLLCLPSISFLCLLFFSLLLSPFSAYAATAPGFPISITGSSFTPENNWVQFTNISTGNIYEAGPITSSGTTLNFDVPSRATTGNYTVRVGAENSPLSATSLPFTVAPPVIPTVSLSASQTTINLGQSTVISWVSHGAYECVGSAIGMTTPYEWQPPELSGSFTFTPTNQNTTLNLSCTGQAGTTARSLAITTTGGSNLPYVELMANPTSVRSGHSTTLSWNISNATSCTSTNMPAGSWSSGSSGSVSTPNLTANATYALTCTGAGGTAPAVSVSVPVTTTTLPDITLTATPNPVIPGQPTTLAWSVKTDNGAYAYQSQFGSGGSGNGQFNTPLGITVSASTGKIFVVDSGNNRIQIFNSDGTFNSTFGSYGTGNNQFNHPTDILLHPNYFFVVDTSNNKIKFYNNSGAYAGTILDGILSAPNAIAYNANYTTMYISDSGHHNIRKWTTGDMGVFGPTVTPTPTYSDLAVDSTGNVYAVDTPNNRVNKFNPAGALLASFGTVQLTNPKNITIVTSELGIDYIHVSNANTSNPVQIFDSSGNYQGRLLDGIGFSQPNGIATDNLGNMYIVDTGNNRVQKYHLPGFTTCDDSGAWSGHHYVTSGLGRSYGSVGISGNMTVTPLATSQTYTMSCTTGSITNTESVVVSSVAVPTATLTASTTPIFSGQSTTLTWSSTNNATSCTASGAWTGTKLTSGTLVVSPTANSTYTITCSGAGGTSSASSVTVTVNTRSGNQALVLPWTGPTSLAIGSSPSYTLNWNATGPMTQNWQGVFVHILETSDPTISFGDYFVPSPATISWPAGNVTTPHTFTVPVPVGTPIGEYGVWVGLVGIVGGDPNSPRSTTLVPGPISPGSPVNIASDGNQYRYKVGTITVTPVVTYIVTAPTVANGTISPASRIVNSGATTAFTVTPSTGYTASVSGCGGSLVGTTYTTGVITANCTVNAVYNVIAIPPPSITINSSSLTYTYHVGDTIPITWTSTGISGATIDLYNYKGSTQIRSIVSSQPASGVYNWTVPADIDFNYDTYYKIRISSTDPENPIYQQTSKVELLPLVSSIVPVKRTLSVSKLGAGSVISTGASSGLISCGTTGTRCTAQVDTGTTIIFGAQPAQGSTFTASTGWFINGAPCPQGQLHGGTCTVIVNSDTTVQANFAPATIPPVVVPTPIDSSAQASSALSAWDLIKILFGF